MSWSKASASAAWLALALAIVLPVIFSDPVLGLFLLPVAAFSVVMRTTRPAEDDVRFHLTMILALVAIVALPCAGYVSTKLGFE